MAIDTIENELEKLQNECPSLDAAFLKIFGDTFDYRLRSTTHWYMLNFKHMNNFTHYNGVVQIFIVSVLLKWQNY